MTNRMPKPLPKNLTEQFREDIIFLIISCFIIYLIIRFFEFLFKPLTDKASLEDIFEERLTKKRKARAIRKKKVANDPNDPMHQFHLRFVEKPDEYKKDKNNEIYEAWFKEWKRGNIIDSTLRWAPKILDEKNEIRSNFIDYMKIQWVLHKKSSTLKRMQFSNTIYKYYPELSASMRGLRNDLANYEAEIIEENMEHKLQDEIQKYGLPEELALYLIEKDINSKKLGHQAQILKEYVEEGYEIETCICALENNLVKEGIKIVDVILKKLGLPTRVGLAVIKEELTAEEVSELYENIQFLRESCGMDIHRAIEGTNTTLYESRIDSELEKYREEKIVTRLNKKD